jgi:TRAP-type C4-dicarboxylate transport system permease small subunit
MQRGRPVDPSKSMGQQPDARPTRPPGALIGEWLDRVGVVLAYCGGAIVAAVGVMSAVSIIGRSAFSHPIMGDFELVEIATAVAGTLFLPYCQASGGNIVVDLFTLGASERTRDWLDRFGAFLSAVMFIVVGWRAAVGSIDLYRSGESSMLMRFPVWLGYAGVLPGVFAAGLVGLAQSFGIKVSGHVPEHGADE